MTAHAFLEDFSDPLERIQSSRSTVTAPVPLQDADAGYDRGYEAGWNDALNSERDEAENNLRDMAVALQENGFTYFEARQHVLKSLRPVLDAISEKILPVAAQLSLGSKVVEALEAVASGLETPIEILCPPAAEETLK